MAGSSVVATALWQARAYATTFLDIEQAQKLLLPQATSFEPVTLTADAALVAELGAVSRGPLPRGFAPQAWVGMADGKRVGWVLSDHVIGKYELIDYAAGFGADGTMTGIEILVYRESHGAEIRTPGWRRQFVGRKGPDQLRFGDDIRSISGATMSCEHVTEGAQRLSVVVQHLAKAPVR